MAKIPQRIVKSYNAYLNYRDKWSDKGYGLDRELSLNEYADAHKAYAHRNQGAQHIAREIAGAERTFTRSEASAIVRRIKTADQFDDVDEEGLKELRKRYKRSKDVYGLELSPEEAAASEQERRNRLAERGKTPEYTIQANARAKLFNELRDLGLSYKEAEEVLYG